MVATMYVGFDNGGSDGSPGSNTIVEGLGPPNLRYKTADNATIDTANPIVIPGTGSTYSYWKQVYLFCSGAPDTQIDNIRFYSDGSSGFGTGVDLKIGSPSILRTGSYEVADTTSDMVTAHTSISAQSSVFDFTSGGTTFQVGISGTGDNIIDAVDEASDYVVLQMQVADDASPGTLSSETLTFIYDEI